MHGTAVGTSKRLPKLYRPSQVVSLADNCTRPLFLFRTPMVQHLTDNLFATGSRLAAEGKQTAIIIELTENQIKEDVRGLLSGGNLSARRDRFHFPRVRASVLLVQPCYEMTEEIQDNPAFIHMKFKFQDPSLRIAACDIGR